MLGMAHRSLNVIDMRSVRNCAKITDPKIFFVFEDHPSPKSWNMDPLKLIPFRIALAKCSHRSQRNGYNSKRMWSPISKASCAPVSSSLSMIQRFSRSFFNAYEFISLQFPQLLDYNIQLLETHLHLFSSRHHAVIHPRPDPHRQEA